MNHYSTSQTGDLTELLASTEEHIYGREIAIAIKENKPE